jgi:hypothetical protein
MSEQSNRRKRRAEVRGCIREVVVQAGNFAWYFGMKYELGGAAVLDCIISELDELSRAIWDARTALRKLKQEEDKCRK